MSGTSVLGPATVPGESSEHEMAAMCETMGGKSFSVNSPKALDQCLQNINSRFTKHSGVLVSLEPLPNAISGGGGGGMPSSIHKIIDVKPDRTGKLNGHWPIPEAYWPPKLTTAIPAREAHPVIKFSQQEAEPQVVDSLPFDKYELQDCSLAKYILSLKRTNVCWFCFVESSHSQPGSGRPFGYLKPASSGNVVNLIVMPYDFPALIPLLKGLGSYPKSQPTQQWRDGFSRYLDNIPGYG